VAVEDRLLDRARVIGRAMDAVARLTLVAIRNSRGTSKLHEHVAAVMRALRTELRGPAVVPALEKLVRNVLTVDGSPAHETRAVLAAALPVETRSSVMTGADQMRAEERREVLVDLLQIRFGGVDSTVRARIDRGSLDELLAWLRRVVTADSLEDVFAS
jgi:hypothetical protein